MNLDQKVEYIEGEVGVMKGEVKQMLVDLREFVMKQGGPFSGGGEGGEGGGLTQQAVDGILEQARSTVQEEISTMGPTGVSHGEVMQMLEGALASRPAGGGEDSSELREELYELKEENRRAIEALRTEQAASSGDPAAAQAIRRELDEMRAAQANSAPGDPAAADTMRREIDQLRSAQSNLASQAVQATQAAQQAAIQASEPRVQVVQQPSVQRSVSQAPQAVQADGAPIQAQVQAPAGEQPRVQAVRIETTSEAPADELFEEERAPQVVRIQTTPPGQTRPEEPSRVEQPVRIPEDSTPEEYTPTAGAEFESTESPTAWPAPGAAMPEPEASPGSTALDANLLTSLMRWVGGVKRRLGTTQLEGFLEIYRLTGHLPDGLERLILHLAQLDALPDESSDQIFTLDDLMDSLLQLHAIVYGPGYASRGALLDFGDALGSEPLEGELPGAEFEDTAEDG